MELLKFNINHTKIKIVYKLITQRSLVVKETEILVELKNISTYDKFRLYITDLFKKYVKEEDQLTKDEELTLEQNKQFLNIYFEGEEINEVNYSKILDKFDLLKNNTSETTHIPLFYIEVFLTVDKEINTTSKQSIHMDQHKFSLTNFILQSSNSITEIYKQHFNQITEPKQEEAIENLIKYKKSKNTKNLKKLEPNQIKSSKSVGVSDKLAQIQNLKNVKLNENNIKTNKTNVVKPGALIILPESIESFKTIYQDVLLDKTVNVFVLCKVCRENISWEEYNQHTAKCYDKVEKVEVLDTSYNTKNYNNLNVLPIVPKLSFINDLNSNTSNNSN